MNAGHIQPSERVATVIAELKELFGERLAVGEAIRRQHANSLTFIDAQLPDTVVWPESTADVVAIVRQASAVAVPLIAFGAGTSLEGHVNAPDGGIAVDFSRMNRVLQVRPDDLDCSVEAGVTRQRLRSPPHRLIFSCGPGSRPGDAWGHGGDRGIRHDHCALRLDAR